jgi:hypothetical protein
MNARHLSRDEIGARGEEIYQHSIKALVEPGNIGKYVAIDTNTGQYEIADGHLEALNRLHARWSNVEAYSIKIGYPATAVIGGRLRPNASETKQ